MDTLVLSLLLAALLVLILLSGFFSGSETAMMALNRYRLRHLARGNHRVAMRVSKLLERPDRLLGVILIGNTFANILASSIATVIALHYFGEVGIAIATFMLTLIILIFAEVTPKTLAAIHPQRFAFRVSMPLKILLKIFYPIVFVVNYVANGFLKIFRVKTSKKGTEHLSSEELTTLIKDSGDKIPQSHQEMLVGILELEKVSVDDIMIPRNDIIGIDLDDDWRHILSKITHSQHTRIPIYEEAIDNIKGLLHIRLALDYLSKSTLNRENLLKIITEPYFVPENTPLHTQLLNFRNTKLRTAFVVDEYGDIQGLVTLEDILEEIVGEFTTDIVSDVKQIRPQSDGSYLVDASMNIRDLNRTMKWNFDTSGPKTLSGAIIECLEMIPKPGICLKISDYPIEVARVKKNRVSLARVFPKK